MIPEASSPVSVNEPSLREWRSRTLAELAAAQGIDGPQDFEALCGAGADLWVNDADFEAFQSALLESRRIGG